LIESLGSVESNHVLLWSGPERVRLQTEMMDAIDTKVGVVLGFSAVAMGELLGYLILGAIESSTPSPLFTLRVVIPIAIGFSAGIVACLVGVFVLFVRKIKIGPSFGWSPPPGGASALLEIWKKCISDNEVILTGKARRARWCIALVLMQLTCYGIAASLLFLRFVSLGHEHHYSPLHFFH
jgi:hypothetical protein